MSADVKPSTAAKAHGPTVWVDQQINTTKVKYRINSCKHREKATCPGTGFCLVSWVMLRHTGQPKEKKKLTQMGLLRIPTYRINSMWTRGLNERKNNYTRSDVVQATLELSPRPRMTLNFWSSCVYILSAGMVAMPDYAVLGIKTKASHMPGKHATNWATSWSK